MAWERSPMRGAGSRSVDPGGQCAFGGRDQRRALLVDRVADDEADGGVGCHPVADDGEVER